MVIGNQTGLLSNCIQLLNITRIFSKTRSGSFWIKYKVQRYNKDNSKNGMENFVVNKFNDFS